MRSPLRLPGLLALALAAAPVGCIKQILTDGQISATRQAAGALDTVGDYELARTATQSALAEFEGMHVLAPDNADAQFLLVKGWAAYGYGFVEDEVEAAEDAGDEDMADYQRRRARMAYDRAIFYGLELLSRRAEGFDGARKNEAALATWLSEHFTSREDAAALFWTGNAWCSRVDLMKGDDNDGPPLIAELYVGVALLERAVVLDPSLEHYAGMVALAAYHARSGMAELDRSRQMFDAALAATGGKALLVPLNYAIHYACTKGDASLYRAMIERVLEAPDPDPYQRLANAIAKRRAKRWLGRKRAKEVCGIDLAAAPSLGAGDGHGL